MKKINYIIMIAFLVLAELFTLAYYYIYNIVGIFFNNPVIPIILFSLIVLVAYFIFCKKSISSNNRNIKIERIIIITIAILTIFKILTLIPIVSLKGEIIEPMKEIDNNYKSYSSFDELLKVANITDTHYNTNPSAPSIPYFGYIGIENDFKNFYIASPIISAEKFYNNSYSKYLKVSQKNNAVYGEDWIDSTTASIEAIQKQAITLALFTIIYEFLIILIPIIIRKIGNEKNAFSN